MTDSFAEQFIVNEKGIPTAVILPIEHYHKILSALNDKREPDILAQSPEFAKLVRKSLEDISLNRVAHWKEVWDEL